MLKLNGQSPTKDMNAAQNIGRRQRLAGESSNDLRSSKAVAPVAGAQAAALSGVARVEAEKKRVADIVQRLRGWSDTPTLPVAKIAELTGLSRMRILQLLENGAFQRKGGEILVGSVHKHFAHRFSTLAEEEKSRRKSRARVAGTEGR